MCNTSHQQNLQELVSTARSEEQEMSSRPSGESPRVFATTPRYFEGKGQMANGNGFDVDYVLNGQNGHDRED